MQPPLNRTSARLARAQPRLLWRIKRRFDVMCETHRISGREFEFTRVSDPDVVLDQVVEKEDRREKLSGKRRISDELHLPYWAELWDSAFGIGHVLVEAGQARDGKTALDLGCGMGFAGMVACEMGYRVMLGDLEADALLFAQYNVPQGQARRLDWRSDRLGQRFDLIIGADVLYDRKQWEYLEPFWREHLKSGGQVLLGEPGRQTGDLFIEWIGSRGWKLARFEQKVATREKAIRLFRLSQGAEDFRNSKSNANVEP
jgi:predicted nicotinamide N-methyase